MTSETTEQRIERKVDYLEGRIRFVKYTVIYGVILALAHSCADKSDYIDLAGRLEQLSANSQPQLITANITGNSTPDKFYQFGNSVAYVEIDGKRVGDYFSEVDK